MEDRKVSFETAKLAKEKGFNETCNSHFEENGSSYDSYGEEFKPNNIQDHEILYARPTQSLLQKWLREVHKVDFTLYLDDDGYTVEWSFLGKTGKWDPKKQGGKEGFKTYEEALEVGLQEALKLIKV